MDTLEQVNQQINNIFASNGITAEGPGEEAFWNAVEDTRGVNPTAATELETLSIVWILLQGGATC